MATTTAHPWMANSVEDIKAEMLSVIGAASIEALFAQIPADHRVQTPIALPPAIRSEAALKRHLRDIAAKNANCETHLNFLGGGIWQHHVPAVCDELVRRQEWLTSVFGSPSQTMAATRPGSSSAASLANCWTWISSACPFIAGAARWGTPFAWPRG